jgi:hypothetical protein
MHISGRRANPCLAMHIGRIDAHRPHYWGDAHFPPPGDHNRAMHTGRITRVLGWRSDCGVDAPNRRLMRPVRII